MNFRQMVMLEQTNSTFLKKKTGLNEDIFAAWSDRWETRNNTVSRKNLPFLKVR